MNKKNTIKKITISFIISVVSIVILIVVGCPNPYYGQYPYQYDTNSGNFKFVNNIDSNTTLDRSIDSNIVYNNTSNSIMDFNTVISTLAKGDTVTLRVNRTEQITTDVSADYYGYEVNGAERLIYCRVKSGVVGAGDSGSPLFYDNKLIGVLCYGVGGDSTLFIARAIEDVISIDTAKNSNGLSNKNTTTVESIGLSKIVDLPSSLLNFPYINQKIDTRFGNDYSTSNGVEWPKNRASSTTTDINTAISIGVAEVLGDIVNYYAIGTASYIKSNKIYAFGHSYEGLGETSLIATDAKMIMMTEGDSIFKLAKITGNIIGDFNLDKDFGVRIEKKYPDMIELTSKITFGTKTTTNVHRLAKIYYSTYWLEIILASQFYNLVSSDELYDIYDITLKLYNNDEEIVEVTYNGQLTDFLYYELDWKLNYSTFNKFSDARAEISLVKTADGENSYYYY